MSGLALLVAGALVLLVLTGIAIGIVDSAQRRAWRRITAERRISWEQRQRVLGREPQPVVLGEVTDEEGRWPGLEDRWIRSSSSSRRALLTKLAQVELEAGRVLDITAGPQDRQIFEIRSELTRLGIWDDVDVATFDRAMAVRNSIVNGIDDSELNPPRIRELDDLIHKLQASNHETE